jgi:RecJ-like exonuclease
MLARVALGVLAYLRPASAAGRFAIEAPWKARHYGAAKFPGEETNLSAVMETVENAGDVTGLLLCSIATRADELPVIKDSEAIHYIGKNVEVRGFVVSVRTSPLGTALINFGRDYPNQTFAGFIEAGAKIATDRWIAVLAGIIIGITGKIELYRGKPQIKLLSVNQIKLVDSHSVR